MTEDEQSGSEVSHGDHLVEEIRTLMNHHDATAEEIQEAVDIATGQCDHIGPTIDEFDGTHTIERCAKCRQALRKWRTA